MAVIVTNKSDRGQMNSYIKNGEWFLKGILLILLIYCILNHLCNLPNKISDITSYSESISYD